MAVIVGEVWLFGFKRECLKGLLVLGKNTRFASRALVSEVRPRRK